MRAETHCSQRDGVWQVVVRLGLDREEVSRLFLLGDILVSWPTEGLLPARSGAPLARGCMYLSEIQSRSGGILLEFGSEVQARSALTALTGQLDQAGVRLATRHRQREESVEDQSVGQRVAAGEEHDAMRDLITGYLDMPGIVAALLVSSQGLVVSVAESEPVDAETIAALVVDVVSAAQRFGRAYDAGPLDTLSLDYGSMGLVLAPFDDDVILALVKKP